MSQLSERVSQFQFTRSWRSREDFPTYEDSEDQVRDDLQRLFDEVRDYLNAQLLPAVNTVTAAEVSAGEGSTVQSALDALRADLTACVLGQIPDGSLTGAKLAPGALLEDVTAQMTLTEETATGNAYQSLRFYRCRALGMLFVQGVVRFTPGGAQTALARYFVSGPYIVQGSVAEVPLSCVADSGDGASRVLCAGDTPSLEVRVKSISSGADAVTASVSGWVFAEEAAS